MIESVPASPTPRMLYTVAEVVELLNLSRSNIYELIRAGHLKTVTVGRCRRISAGAIHDYVRALEKEAGDGQAA